MPMYSKIEIAKGFYAATKDVIKLDKGQNHPDWKRRLQIILGGTYVDSEPTLSFLDVATLENADLTTAVANILDEEVNEDGLNVIVVEAIDKIKSWLFEFLVSTMETQTYATLFGADGNLIMDTRDGKLLWNAINANYAGYTGELATVVYKNELVKMKQKNEESIQNYGNRFSKLLSSFSLAGGRMDGSEVRRTFLNGVSKHLTQTGYTIYQQPFRGLQNDIQSLMHADIAYRIENDISDSKKAKFAAAHGQSPTQKCTFCEKMGHPKKRCYKYKKWKANQQQEQESKSKAIDSDVDSSDDDDGDDSDDYSIGDVMKMMKKISKRLDKIEGDKGSARKSDVKIGKGTNQFDRARNGFIRSTVTPNGAVTTGRFGMARAMVSASA